MNIPPIKRDIDVHIPVTTCTLHCPYCYIFHRGLFKAKLPQFKYSPEVVKKALSVERLGGVCLINMTGGGETLLPPQIVEYIRVLLENGHYVAVVTNGTVTRAFDNLCAMPQELLSRLFFKFSYHYLQLKQKNLLQLFFNNIRKMRDAGCSFTLEFCPHDEAIPYIEELKQRSIDELGAPPHVTIARDDISPDKKRPVLSNMTEEQYWKTWGVINSDMFDFKTTIFGKKRCEFCYAGDWSFYLNLGTGIKSQCYGGSFKWENIFDNPEKPINFTPIGYKCPLPHCYNGHASLTLGLIPELDTPTYASTRNRVCADGSEWLKPNVKAFFSGKLKNNNREYSFLEKGIHQIRYNYLKKLRSKLKKTKKA